MLASFIGPLTRMAAVGAIAASLTATAQAFSYDELLDGDLANAYWTPSGGGLFAGGTPTAMPALAGGLNTIVGKSTVGDGFDNLDYDAFTFIVNSGQSLSEFSVDVDTQAWAIVTKLVGGNYVTQGLFYNGGSPGQLQINVGDTIDGGTPVNVDLLAMSGPIGPGTYGILIRNGIGYNQATDYTFYLDLVPEPAAVVMLAGAALLLLRRRSV